jgi:hypothetical protein
LARFEFNPGQFCFVFLLPLFHSENRVCLSHGVQVAGVPWHAMMRTVAGVGDLVQRTGDGRTGREVGWHHMRSAPGTQRLGARVSWLRLKTKVDGF